LRWTRRGVVLLALAGLVAAAALAPLAGAGDRDGINTRIVMSSGRAYVLHVPPLLRGSPALGEGRPAMVVLHGWQDTAEASARNTRFADLSDRDGVLVAWPEGVRASFNAGLCCGDAAALRVDDVAFLTEVVGQLKARGAGRIAVVGFSNGGMMAYRFACERPDLVDTVGVMSGTLEIPHCKGPIRALALHGLHDHSVPYRGLLWSTRLQAFLRDVRTIPAAAPGSDITIRTVPDLAHSWTGPGDAVDASAEFWAFARMAG
jgi:polyhydroxybutyrate depolymerase